MDLGKALNNLSNTLSFLGQDAEALDKIQQAVAGFRKSSEANSKKYRSYLGCPLINLFVCLGWMGQPHEAQRMIQESVDIYRQLVDADHDDQAYAEYLSLALCLLSIRLDKLGSQPAESIKPLQEAVRTYRKLCRR